MPWTTEEKLRALLGLPWTIQAADADEPGERVLRVEELPGFLVVGTPQELDAEFWSALREFLGSFLEYGDPIPLPAGVAALPWERAEEKERRLIVRMGQGRAWDIEEASAESAGNADPSRTLVGA